MKNQNLSIYYNLCLTVIKLQDNWTTQRMDLKSILTLFWIFAHKTYKCSEKNIYILNINNLGFCNLFTLKLLQEYCL